MATTQPRLAQLNGKGTLQVAGQLEFSLGAAIASANNLVTGSDGNVFHVTGTTQINLISGANWQAGSQIVLIFNSACVVKNLQTVSSTNYPIVLFGNSDYNAGANSVLHLHFDGAYWYDNRLGLTISGTVNKVSSLPASSASNEGNLYLLNAAPASSPIDVMIAGTSSVTNYWKMNEAASNGTIANSVGTANFTNLSSVTQGTAGGAGDGENSADFTGTGSYASGPTAPAPMQSGDFSCEFAVKRTATSAQTLIGDNTHDYWRIQVGYAGVSNQLQFIGNGGSVLCQSASTVASNAWDHWIVTYTGGTMKMYRNGNLDVTQTGITFANRPASTDAIRLGDATGGGFSLVGYLQKMALYNSALSSGTVTSHYNAWVQAESAATNDVLYVSEQNSSGTFAMRQICDNLSFLPDFAPTGLIGATAASRYVGATTGGAPATGTFAAGDFVIDQTGAVWVCTAAGTPGTWQASTITAATFSAATYSGLQMWLKANAITGLTNGQSLSTWSDASGNGNNAAAGTAPTYQTGQVNGLPAVEFASGSSQYLACTSYNPAGKFTCIFVAKFGTTGNVFSNAYVHTDDGGWTFAYNSGNILFQSGIGTATWPSGANTGGTALDTGNYQIYSVVQGYGNLNIRVHGAVANVVNVLSPAAGDSHGFLIGSLYNGGYGGFWSGYLAEVLIYNRELSAAEVAGVEEYLALKYGL